MTLRRKIQQIRRARKVKYGKKFRATINEMVTFVPYEHASRAAILLKKKSTSKLDTVRTEIDSRLDSIAINLCFRRFSPGRAKKPSEFVTAYLKVLNEERALNLSPSKEEKELSTLHYAAEEKMGNKDHYFIFTVLFPSVRLALIRKAQNLIKTEKT